MFENLFKKKYLVKDLYVTYPVLITKCKDKSNMYICNETKENLPLIIVYYDQIWCYVKNVLNGRLYGIVNRFADKDKLSEFVNQYMVNKLTPLELFLDDKNKKFITVDEIKELLYPELKKEDNESNYHDAVLREINEVNNKINSSKISLSEKEEYKKMLIEIANYYVESLKTLSVGKNNQDLSLEVNKKSIYSLRNECMQKLVEIELRLPPEDINDLIGELNLLEENIKRKIL